MRPSVDPAERHPPTRSCAITPGVDLTDEQAVTAYYAGLPPLWASVHLAGGYAGAPVADTGLAAARALLDMNFVTAFLCCREAVRNMRGTASGSVSARPGGRIVNVAAVSALQPAAGAASYAASKAAVAALTRALAQEVGTEGIRVNALAPGTIDTATNRAAMPGADPGRWVKPAELAEAILWLISPAATAVNGAVIPVG